MIVSSMLFNFIIDQAPSHDVPCGLSWIFFMFAAWGYSACSAAEDKECTHPWDDGESEEAILAMEGIHGSWKRWSDEQYAQQVIKVTDSLPSGLRPITAHHLSFYFSRRLGEQNLRMEYDSSVKLLFCWYIVLRMIKLSFKYFFLQQKNIRIVSVIPGS